VWFKVQTLKKQRKNLLCSAASSFSPFHFILYPKNLIIIIMMMRMSSSSFPLSLNPKPFHPHKQSHSTLSPFQFSKHTTVLPLSRSTLSKPHYICFSSNPDREESRWLREEQRWLREEERWLREEKRWSRDRESLLAQIQSLKLQIEALENRISVLQGGEDTVAKVGLLLQVLKDKNNNNLIAESGSSARPLVLEENVVEEQKEVIDRVLEEKKEKERKTLRKGSEGEQVKEMQV
jgi:hypothetical protein